MKIKKLHLMLTAFCLAPSVAFAAGSSEGGHSFNLMKEVVYPWINFLGMSSILFFVLRKPAREFFASRSKTIAHSVQQSAHEKQEARHRYQQAQRRLEKLQGELNDQIDSFQKEGELLRQKMLQEAYEASKRAEEINQMIIRQESQKLKEELRQEFAKEVKKMAESEIRTSFRESDQEKKVLSTVDKMASLEASI